MQSAGAVEQFSCVNKMMVLRAIPQIVRMYRRVLCCYLIQARLFLIRAPTDASTATFINTQADIRLQQILSAPATVSSGVHVADSAPQNNADDEPDTFNTSTNNVFMQLIAALDQPSRLLSASF